MKKYAWCLLAFVAGALATQAYGQTATASAGAPAATNPAAVAATGTGHGAQSSAAQVANADNDPNRRVCWQETPVGTHFHKTVCKTAAEMQREKDQTDHMMNQSLHLKRQSNLGPRSSAL